MSGAKGLCEHTRSHRLRLGSQASRLILLLLAPPLGLKLAPACSLQPFAPRPPLLSLSLSPPSCLRWPSRCYGCSRSLACSLSLSLSRLYGCSMFRRAHNKAEKWRYICCLRHDARETISSHPSPCPAGHESRQRSGASLMQPTCQERRGSPIVNRIARKWAPPARQPKRPLAAPLAHPKRAPHQPEETLALLAHTRTETEHSRRSQPVARNIIIVI